jgi:hypothetical protein
MKMAVAKEKGTAKRRARAETRSVPQMKIAEPTVPPPLVLSTGEKALEKRNSTRLCL